MYVFVADNATTIPSYGQNYDEPKPLQPNEQERSQGAKPATTHGHAGASDGPHAAWNGANASKTNDAGWASWNGSYGSHDGRRWNAQHGSR